MTIKTFFFTVEIKTFFFKIETIDDNTLGISWRRKKAKCSESACKNRMWVLVEDINNGVAKFPCGKRDCSKERRNAAEENFRLLQDLADKGVDRDAGRDNKRLHALVELSNLDEKFEGKYTFKTKHGTEYEVHIWRTDSGEKRMKVTRLTQP